MRKIYTLLLLAVASLSNAQVPNSDFEQGFGYGLENVADWGQFFMFTVTLDENTNEYVQDDITFGESMLGMFCSSVEDPHSGQRAMLIRNAFNNTSNQVIPGKVNLFNNAISEQPTGWNTGIPVAPDAVFNSLSFWYKFNRVGNDVAEVSLLLHDADGNELGTAKILLTETATDYTYVSMPITFTGIGDPGLLNITFFMEAEGSEATFGSSLTVDDLSVNSLLATNTFTASAFSIFPTIANQEINVIKNSSTPNGKYNFTIINAEGRIVSNTSFEMQTGMASKINVGSLASGVYFLKTDNGGKTFTTKFIKK
ncbi:MAG TPA: T9SS type A sorting domain-containing protein [Flavobacterium sp.]|nr:T9SS type A sorting domain-containing protein [Flavobacterium sp.]